MENINVIIAEYLAEKDRESAAKKRAEYLKSLILDHIGNADHITTEEYTIIVKTSESVRLDTKALYNDFPDIKETYGKTTVSRTIAAARIAASDEKTA